MFCNPNLVKNICEVNEHMNVLTNGGVMTTNLKADLPNWGEVWYSPHAIINIFNFCEMERRYPISYHHGESKFTVHLPQKTVDFKNDGNNLYLLKLQIKNDKNNYNFINTVEENKAFYTHRQFEKAKKARDLYHAIGTPSINDFKAIVRMNAIRNNPVTLQVIQLVENIFGPDVGSLKGKGTRTKPIPVVSDYVEVPTALYQKQHQVVLCIDTLKINGLFLATILQNIKYRTVHWISSKTTKVYKNALKEIFRIYNKASFHIVEIRCDNKYTGMMDDIEDKFHVHINYASAQEHEPEAEQINRVLEERYRAIYHRLPYQHLPRLIIKHLAYNAARYLNYFPSKTGVSNQFSQQMIMHQEVLDYNKQCAYTFGSYVQANTETTDKNANHLRTLDCIYLRPTSNHQGGHKLMDARTGWSITRQYITQVSITEQIISTIHKIAENKKAPKGLKIKTKTGTILYNAAWLAGVDYTTNNNEDIDSKDDTVDDKDKYYMTPFEYETKTENIDPNEMGELLGGEIQEQEDDNKENEDSKQTNEQGNDNEENEDKEQPTN